MTREINYEVAKFAANNHEIYGLVDAEFYKFEYNNTIRTRMNQSTLMDLWNNSVERTLGANNNLKYMNYDDLFYYASNNGMLILDVNTTYERLGIQSYVQESDWTVGVDWNLETGNVTIMKEGLPNITLKVGI